MLRLCIACGNCLVNRSDPLRSVRTLQNFLCHLVWHHSVSYDNGWNICFSDGVRLESSHSLGLDSLRDQLRDACWAKPTQSNQTCHSWSSHILLYLCRLCGNAIICNFATQPCSILNNRLLLYEISSRSVITCIIVTLYGIITIYGKLSSLLPQIRKHIFSSL